jgi:hypothetical protein
MSMLDIEPTSVAAIVTYKKRNQMFSSYFLFLKTIRLVHLFQVVPFQSHMLTFMSWTSYHSSLENGNAKGFAKRIHSFHCGARMCEDLAIPSLQVMTWHTFIL